MSRGPETSFINSVNRHLPKSVHYEKMHDEYHSGRADSWYSGAISDLWVEYKFVKIPKRATTPIRLWKLFSDQQLRWLAERKKEGRQVVVIVGVKEGGYFHGAVFTGGAPNEDWTGQISVHDFVNKLLTSASVCEWIRYHCEGSLGKTIEGALRNPGPRLQVRPGERDRHQKTV